jgi:hypothetical protein
MKMKILKMKNGTKKKTSKKKNCRIPAIQQALVCSFFTQIRSVLVFLVLILNPETVSGRYPVCFSSVDSDGDCRLFHC